VVDSALDAIEKGRRAVIPGRMVRLSMLTVRSIPNSIKLPVIKRIISARGD
jgi:hypothetical protein